MIHARRVDPTARGSDGGPFVGGGFWTASAALFVAGSRVDCDDGFAQRGGAQATSPGWVKARARHHLSARLLQGSMAGGSARSGVESPRASAYRRPCSPRAALLALAGMALAWRFPLDKAKHAGLRAVRALADADRRWRCRCAEHEQRPGAGDGRISCLTSTKVPAFAEMQKMQRIRRRDGAIHWGIYRGYRRARHGDRKLHRRKLAGASCASMTELPMPTACSGRPCAPSRLETSAAGRAPLCHAPALMRTLFLLPAALPPVAAQAQRPSRPTFATTRIGPCCQRRPAKGWREAKYIPLTDDGAAYLTLGGEAPGTVRGRGRRQSVGRPACPRRWLSLAARRAARRPPCAGPARVFVQGIAGYARGVGAGKGPVDETGIDLLRGFADVRVRLGDNGNLTLRAGRELVALGSETARRHPLWPQHSAGVRRCAPSPITARSASTPFTCGPSRWKTAISTTEPRRRFGGWTGVYATIGLFQRHRL